MRARSSDSDPLMAISILSAGLWRVREVLDELAFRLEVQRLMLESDNYRWLDHATRDVETSVRRLQQVELVRAIDAGPVCDALGLPPNTPLSWIAATAPTPWGQVLEEHRLALNDSLGELAGLSRTTNEHLTEGYLAVEAALARMHYTHEDSPTDRSTRHR